MRDPRFLWLLFFCLTFPAATLRAQSKPANEPITPATSIAPAANPQTPAEFFARARQLGDLIAAGMPFHLKAHYVATGDAEFTGNGTFEEWWESKDTWRKEATLGDFQYVAIKNAGKFGLYTSPAYIPLRLRQAVHSLPTSFPGSAAVFSGDWVQKHKKLSGIDLVVLYRDDHSGKKPLLVRAYYFSENGLLRIRVIYATVTVYNQFQAFQNLLIPRKIQVSNGAAPFLTITVDSLQPLDSNQPTLTRLTAIPSGLQSAEPMIRQNSRLSASRLIQQPRSHYPLEARQQRIQGTVVIAAVIDSQGGLREPYVIHSAGPVLDGAALQDVRQYKYQPTSIDGRPIAVQTTIRFVYTLKQ